MAGRTPHASTSRLSMDTQIPDPRPVASVDRNRRAKPAPSPAAAAVPNHDMSYILSSSTSTVAANPLSQNAYIASLNLGATFTSAGTMPKSTTSKPVAQRRAQAPPIVVSDVRKVSRSELDQYVNTVEPLIQRWKGERAASETSSKFLRDSSREQHADEEQLPPLEAVPPIFFDSAFNLSNPRTFDLVTEKIRELPIVIGSEPPDADEDGTGGSSTRPGTPDSGSGVVRGLGPLTLADLAKDEMLQEKLSHYTAVVESHLVREIGQRSSAFFAALSNLQGLHSQGQDCLDAIALLERSLAPDQPGVGAAAIKSLKVLRAQGRRRALERIREGLRRVEQVHRALQGTKELVETGQWTDAIEVADQVEDLYYGRDFYDSASGDPDDEHRAAESRKVRLNPSRLKALAAVPVQLSLLRSQVAKSLSVELVNVLDHEMELSVEDYIRTASASHAIEPSWANHPERAETARSRVRDRTQDVLTALVRSSGMEDAIAAWRESVLKDVRSMVREHLPSGGGTPSTGTPLNEAEDALALAGGANANRASVDLGSISEKSASLAKKLRAMPHHAFLSLARNTYIGLLACLEVIDVHAQVMADLYARISAEERTRKEQRRTRHQGSTQNGNNDDETDPSTKQANDDTVAKVNSLLSVPGSTPAPTTPSAFETRELSPSLNGSGGDDPLRSEILDVVQASADLANQRFSKVVTVRTEVHANLDLGDFGDFFDESWSFVVACETVCKRMIVGLRGVVIGQAKSFLQQFHQKRITEVARSVENEQWQAVDVPAKSQRTVETIIESAVADPARLLLGNRKHRDAGSLSNGTAASQNGQKDDATAKQIDVEGKTFFAVSAGLACLDSVVDYLQVVLNCPLLATDVMSKVIEFLKAYNSRTCQVVLGAGAMRSAGLKNITAKHLALASQALSIVISLVPYIREALRRHLNPKQAVMLVEFDKLKRDYQEHQNEIHAKLVAIMADRLQVHSRALQGTDWEQTGQSSPNAYMESLVKEHATLYKVLSRFLHASSVDSIMAQVFDALERRLSQEFGSVEFKSEAAKDRAIADVSFMKTKLADLRGGLERDPPGTSLEDELRRKEVTAPPPPPPSAPQTVSTSAGSQSRPSMTLSRERQSSGPVTAQTTESASPRSSLEKARPTDASGPSTAVNTPVISPPLSRVSSETGLAGSSASLTQASTGTAPSAPSTGPQKSPLLTPVRKPTMKERLAELARRKPSLGVGGQQKQAQPASQAQQPQIESVASSSVAPLSSQIDHPLKSPEIPAQPPAAEDEEDKGPPTPAKDDARSPVMKSEEPSQAFTATDQPAQEANASATSLTEEPAMTASEQPLEASNADPEDAKLERNGMTELHEKPTEDKDSGPSASPDAPVWPADAPVPTIEDPSKDEPAQAAELDGRPGDDESTAAAATSIEQAAVEDESTTQPAEAEAKPEQAGETVVNSVSEDAPAASDEAVAQPQAIAIDNKVQETPLAPRSAEGPIETGEAVKTEDDIEAEVDRTLAENGVDGDAVDEDIEEEQADFL